MLADPAAVHETEQLVVLVLMAIFSAVVTAPLWRYYLGRMGHIIPARTDL